MKNPDLTREEFETWWARIDALNTKPKSELEISLMNDAKNSFWRMASNPDDPLDRFAMAYTVRNEEKLMRHLNISLPKIH